MTFLECTFPDFGMPVLYEEQLFIGIRKKYTFPPYLVEGYQNFAENIDKYVKADQGGANLAILDDFVGTRRSKQVTGEQECYDQVYKKLKLLNVQVQSGTEAYEAEAKSQ